MRYIHTYAKHMVEIIDAMQQLKNRHRSEFSIVADSVAFVVWLDVFISFTVVYIICWMLDIGFNYAGIAAMCIYNLCKYSYKMVKNYRQHDVKKTKYV